MAIPPLTLVDQIPSDWLLTCGTAKESSVSVDLSLATQLETPQHLVFEADEIDPAKVISKFRVLVQMKFVVHVCDEDSSNGECLVHHPVQIRCCSIKRQETET